MKYDIRVSNVTGLLVGSPLAVIVVLECKRVTPYLRAYLRP